MIYIYHRIKLYRFSEKEVVVYDNRIMANEYRTITVCVDSYDNGVLKGCLYNPYLNGGKSFQSLSKFLLEMEQTLNLMEFPKSFTVNRAFAVQPKQASGPFEVEFRTGKIATFKIRVLFRQNASWQGSILWLEGNREQSFRSVLELFLLMDNALTYEQTS